MAHKDWAENKFNIGDVICVCDRKDQKNYKCKILKKGAGKIRIHYVGWKRSYDEWLDINNSRIGLNSAEDHDCDHKDSEENVLAVFERSLDNALDVFERSLDAFSSGRITAQDVCERIRCSDSLTSQKNTITLSQIGTRQTVEAEVHSYPRSPRFASTPVDGNGGGVDVPARFRALADAPVGPRPEVCPRPDDGDGVRPSDVCDMDEIVVCDGDTIPGELGSGENIGLGRSELPVGPSETSHNAELPQTGINPEQLERSFSGGLDRDGCVCSFCRQTVHDIIISCGQCKSIFHADPRCTGITRQAVDAITADVTNSLAYFCIKCRLGSRTADDTLGLVGRADGPIVNIEAAVGQLYQLISAHHSQVLPSGDGCKGSNDLTNGDLIREVVRDEVGKAKPVVNREEVRTELREMDDQSRRKRSVILRGFGSANVREAVQKVEQICDYLSIQGVNLSDVSAIRGCRGMFRAKILDDLKRQDLLSAVAGLKDSSDFRTMYIHRDLTYNQRQTLRLRRGLPTADKVNQQVSQPAVTAVPPQRGAFVRGRRQRGTGVAGTRPTVSASGVTHGNRTPDGSLTVTNSRLQRGSGEARGRGSGIRQRGRGVQYAGTRRGSGCVYSQQVQAAGGAPGARRYAGGGDRAERGVGGAKRGSGRCAGADQGSDEGAGAGCGSDVNVGTGCGSGRGTGSGCGLGRGATAGSSYGGGTRDGRGPGRSAGGGRGPGSSVGAGRGYVVGTGIGSGKDAGAGHAKNLRREQLPPVG